MKTKKVIPYKIHIPVSDRRKCTVGEIQVFIHCPFCGEDHVHGYDDGFRVPHCKDLDVKKDKAYFIDCANIASCQVVLIREAKPI